MLEDHMPSMYRATDSIAIAGQADASKRTRSYLGLLTVGAVGSAVDWDYKDYDLGAAVAVIAFVGALFLGLTTRLKRPEALWYVGRAGAESIKTLTWSYSVGGEPYPLDLDDADGAFVARLSQIRARLRDLSWPAVAGDQITDEMRSLRASSPQVRRDVYLRERVEGQLSWYLRRAGEHKDAGRRWGLATSLSTLAGLGFGILQSFRVLEVDIFGVCATLAASCVAWTELKQHESLAAAYAITAQDLQLVKAAAASVSTERQWADFVTEAEEAMSREHTMWLARRGRHAALGE